MKKYKVLIISLILLFSCKSKNDSVVNKNKEIKIIADGQVKYYDIYELPKEFKTAINISVDDNSSFLLKFLNSNKEEITGKAITIFDSGILSISKLDGTFATSFNIVIEISTASKLENTEDDGVPEKVEIVNSDHDFDDDFESIEEKEEKEKLYLHVSELGLLGPCPEFMSESKLDDLLEQYFISTNSSETIQEKKEKFGEFLFLRIKNKSWTFKDAELYGYANSYKELRDAIWQNLDFLKSKFELKYFNEFSILASLLRIYQITSIEYAKTKLKTEFLSGKIEIDYKQECTLLGFSNNTYLEFFKFFNEKCPNMNKLDFISFLVVIRLNSYNTSYVDLNFGNERLFTFPSYCYYSGENVHYEMRYYLIKMLNYYKTGKNMEFLESDVEDICTAGRQCSDNKYRALKRIYERIDKESGVDDFNRLTMKYIPQYKDPNLIKIIIALYKAKIDALQKMSDAFSVNQMHGSADYWSKNFEKFGLSARRDKDHEFNKNLYLTPVADETLFTLNVKSIIPKYFAEAKVLETTFGPVLDFVEYGSGNITKEKLCWNILVNYGVAEK